MSICNPYWWTVVSWSRFCILMPILYNLCLLRPDCLVSIVYIRILCCHVDPQSSLMNYCMIDWCAYSSCFWFILFDVHGAYCRNSMLWCRSLTHIDEFLWCHGADSALWCQFCIICVSASSPNCLVSIVYIRILCCDVDPQPLLMNYGVTSGFCVLMLICITCV